MNIKDGGAISNLKNSDKIHSIFIVALNDYMFELWINNDCLSYLDLRELLELKDNVQKQLEISIK